MAGHNKWSKVKHKKAVTDARKSKTFSKYAQLIAAESKNVGGDTSAPALKALIERAKGESMPQENIDRAVRRGAGLEGGPLEEVIYEAYGPGGTAMIVQAMTDNRNRTAAEVKHALSKHGYALAEPGAASWAFAKDAQGFTPHTTIALDVDTHAALTELVEALETLDDVGIVTTNATESEQ
jgi:YebC/PmpR family DNA-binding regulatory protein